MPGTYEETRTEPLLRKTEVMDILGGISLRSLDRLIADGALPVIKIGRLVRFEPAAVRDLVERSRREASP